MSFMGAAVQEFGTRGRTRCERHGLAAGTDGQCAICRRERVAFDRALTRQADRSRRRLAAGVIAVIALVAAFSLLMATFDTTDGKSSATPAVTEASKAVSN